MRSVALWQLRAVSERLGQNLFIYRLRGKTNSPLLESIFLQGCFLSVTEKQEAVKFLDGMDGSPVRNS